MKTVEAPDTSFGVARDDGGSSIESLRFQKSRG